MFGALACLSGVRASIGRSFTDLIPTEIFTLGEQVPWGDLDNKVVILKLAKGGHPSLEGVDASEPVLGVMRACWKSRGTRASPTVLFDMISGLTGHSEGTDA
jgi:hypothetical protein